MTSNTIHSSQGPGAQAEPSELVKSQPAGRARRKHGVKRKSTGAPITLALLRDRSIVEPATGCWIYQGARSRGGYGVIKTPTGTTRAHRLAYILASGETLASNIDVCHRCDVRPCCNPDHLFAGTRRDNMRDCADKGRIRVPALSGAECPNSKLTPNQVRAIRVDPRSNRAMARALGVDKGTISCIRRGLTWRSLA